MAKKKNPKKPIPKKTPTPVIIVEKRKGFFERFWALIVGIGVLISIVIAWGPFRDLFKTQQERYADQTFLQGDIETSKIDRSEEPPDFKDAKITPYQIADTVPNFQAKPISATNPKVNGVLIDSYPKRKKVDVFVNSLLFRCALDDLKKGIKLFSTSLSSCTDTNLTIGIKDDRLYVSTMFKDIEKEETVGFIEYNHWKLFKPNLLDFRNDDQKLEVKDKQGRIVFSVKFSKEQNVVFISGYFVSLRSILILRNPVQRLITDPAQVAYWNKKAGTSKGVSIRETSFKEIVCVSKADVNWKQKAIAIIEQITSVF